MVAVPAETPVTTGDVEPTDAIVPSLLLQVPPPGAEPRVIVEPAHTVDGPVISDGTAFTITGVVI